MGLTGTLSMVARGTAFEQRSLNLLHNHFSMSLSRVGGASDGGVDLHGWWWLPPSNESTLPSSAGVVPTASSAEARRRIRVLAQCKAYAKKIGPNVVREMEGVLLRHAANEDQWLSRDLKLHESGKTVKEDAMAVLISKSPFTKQTILRTMSSSIPFLLLHLPDPKLNPLSLSPATQLSEGAVQSSKDNQDDPGIASILWNRALSGADGILQGEYEIRWFRTPDDTYGRPVVWRNGQPVESSLLSA